MGLPQVSLDEPEGSPSSYLRTPANFPSTGARDLACFSEQTNPLASHNQPSPPKRIVVFELNQSKSTDEPANICNQSTRKRMLSPLIKPEALQITPYDSSSSSDQKKPNKSFLFTDCDALKRLSPLSLSPLGREKFCCIIENEEISRFRARKSLVGSFEESVLSGRLCAATCTQKLDGFLAVLSVAGGSFSPKSMKLPFSVTSVDEDCHLLYYASIEVTKFRVPITGRIQLVLSNPEKTPLHTFLCNYDLNEMPSNTKTFMRQKVSVSNSLRYALHLRFLCAPCKKISKSLQRCQSDPLPDTRRFYLYNDLRVVFPQRHSDTDEGKMTIDYHYPENPRFFEMGS